MRTLLRLCLVLGLLLAALLPASGASVIFYSKADNSYGWCAGYSYGRGESCAREQCLEYGSKCELAIECDGGWSATAFAPDPLSGFGASCEWQSAGVARSIALVVCIYASHALCSTSEAFDGSGRAASEKSNDAYDLAWYTQTLLLTLGYDIGEVDGAIGSKTRAAIRDVQSAIGIEATGEADWSLMWYLTYLAGGPGKFVADTIASIDAADQHVVDTYTFRYASVPGVDLTLPEAIATLDDQWRRNILAALSTYAQVPCAIPAHTAAQTDDANAWAVSCNEGDYLLGFGGPTLVVAKAEDGLSPLPIPVTCPVVEPTRNDKPSSLSLNDPGPSYKPSLNSENSSGKDYKPSLNTANTPGPLSSLVPVEDCDQPSPTDCSPADPAHNDKPSLVTLNQPAPGKTYKPSMVTENAPGPSKDYKPSLNAANTPGPLGDLVPVDDCPPAASSGTQADAGSDFKPSPNTVNGMAPGLGTALGAAAQ